MMTSRVERNRARGKVIVVSGPSGVGKSTICREVVKRLDDVQLSVSLTTRPPGAGEQDGRDYWFVSESAFRERIERGLLLEYAEVFGNWYGTPKDKMDQMLEAGQSVILEIDVQGGRQAKRVYPDAVMVFILPPDDKALAERIGRRGRDDVEVVETRLNGASNEIAAAWQDYDNMVINEDLEHAVNEVMQIVRGAPQGQESPDGPGGHIGDE